ncbi:glutamyl-tRNA(Gln) amidotransferase subunit B, mitochondrial [Anopheles bellator]|uniref:glutamyl-tRNA(Gln) amidotransferase subunit B, mitochondrial n=1 Tax=Anopheles bellator TaxID=139047 RepID=UPI0026487F2E|nr:glutamyl-tRNA(Gln) amidotransferase subunit B, mitochondrial [Anopheles bellator]
MSLPNRLYRYFASTAAPARKARTALKGVVGLEVHAQLETQSKLFSGARAEFGAAVNTCVSLFDASIPGTLPVLNRSAVELGIKTALALGCEVNAMSMFDRKHYFYADLPAGYQITQQHAPLATRGFLSFPVLIPGKSKAPYYKTASIHQLQLEQDSGKSLHDPVERKSLVDLNRAGMPLIEIVFEPDLETGEEAASLVKELILILMRLKSCSCKMEEGALRVDANISVHEHNTPLGTRTEVKNIGSVRAVAQAVDYEINRQMDILAVGGIIHNETRSWDAAGRVTVPMRDKEVVQDYRFMPEPNLPPLHLKVNNEQTDATDEDGLIDVQKIKQSLPELPEETRQRIMATYGVSPTIAMILVNDVTLHDHFHSIVEEEHQNRPPKLVANFLINEFLTILHRNKMEPTECSIRSTQLAKIVDMIQQNQLNAHYARLVLHELLNTEGSQDLQTCPIEIVSSNNWFLITDESQIDQHCQQVIDMNPKLVKQYRSGKEKMLYALAGEVAKTSEQKVDMVKAVEFLKKMLK